MNSRLNSRPPRPTPRPTLRRCRRQDPRPLAPRDAGRAPSRSALAAAAQALAALDVRGAVGPLGLGGIVAAALLALPVSSLAQPVDAPAGAAADAQAGVAVDAQAGVAADAAAAAPDGAPAGSLPADGPAARHYDIPGGALEAVLGRFGGEAGILLSFDAALVQQRHSAGLQGRFGSADAALAVLLAGTGLQATRLDNGGYILRAAPAAAPEGRDGAAATLPAVRVTGRSAAEGTTEGTGAYTATGPSRTATGLALSARETPQSVSVVTRQQMDDFNLTTLQDVAAVTPGLYLKNGGVSDQESQPHARGFVLDHLNIDGVPLSTGDFNSRSISADMAMYDRVEVVRGATGLLQGAGAPSGTINLVRKRPTAEPLLNLSAGLGSWNHVQLGVDASRPLNDARTLRGRVVLAGERSDSFVDVTRGRNGTLYGIVEADLGPATRLGVGASVQRTRTRGLFRGLPTYTDGRHMNLPRSTYLDTPDSFQDRDNDVVFADLEHRFEHGWSARLALNHTEAESDSRYTWNGRIEGSDTTFTSPETGWRYDTNQDVLDLRAQGPVDAFGRRHELLVGASYRSDDVNWQQSWSGSGEGRIVELGRWDPQAHRLKGAVPADPLRQQRRTKEKGLYAAGKLSLADSLHLVLGGRLGWYTQDGTGWFNGVPNWRRTLSERGEFVPYAGLVYDLDARHSLYGSITEIFQPQSAVDVNGNVLDPLRGINQELGVKGEYLDGRLNASAAVFRVLQRNRAVNDDANCPTSGVQSCSRAAGEIESQGLELQVSGEPSNGWQLSAGYSFVNAEYRRDGNPANVGRRVSTDEPRHQFKLYTSHRLPAGFERWRVDASLQFQSGFFSAEPGFRAEQGRYGLVGVGAAYQVNEGLLLQLNVDNLFDKTYYTELGYSWGGYGDRYGAPRRALLSLKYSFL